MWPGLGACGLLLGAGTDGQLGVEPLTYSPIPERAIRAR
jgi:hypothetical protein